LSAERERIPVDGVPDFWQRVSSAPERCLVLDYDGTLAPFRRNRMDALPLEGVLDDLKTIRDSGTTSLALITGRPLLELVKLIGDLRIPMAGSHGFEFLLPGGSIERGELTPQQEARFVRAEREARATAPDARIERKPASVGLHTRGMPEARARELHEAVASIWTRDAAEVGMECRRFSGGVELRLKAVHKGTALARLLEGHGPGALCVYVGDNETDEDAFGALPDSGIGIKVGPRGVRTRALGRLEDPHAVRGLLETWIATTKT
jgi:trehalose 6-phosphate phosphatase